MEKPRTLVSVTRTLEFDAAHRIMGHESKCASLHGHRYKVELTAVAPCLDSLGRVVDFSVLKEKVGSWIDRFWDHTVILFDEDAETVKLILKCPHAKAPFITDWNPTAENMAKYLLESVCPTILLDKGGLKVVKVRVWETPNCFAEAEIDG